jgi:hypothetical protein
MPEGKSVAYIAIFISLGFVLYYAPSILRHRKSLDERAFTLWIIGWLICLGSVFSMDETFVLIGKLSGIPNLAWLLTYLCIILCLYYCTKASSAALRGDLAYLKLLTWIVALTVVSFTLIFFLGGLAFGPIILMRTPAYSFSELLGMGLVYLYNTILFFKMLTLSTVMILNNRLWEKRIRASILFVVYFSGVIYSVLRMFLTVLLYYSLVRESRFIYGLQSVLITTLAITLLAWPAAFIPSALLRLPQQILDLYHLNYLHQQIRANCSPPMGDRLAPEWTQIKHIQFYSDAIMIFVLDVKRLLKEKRLTLHDDELNIIIDHIDDTLTKDQLIKQCVIQSRWFRQLKKSGGEKTRYGQKIPQA